jgi:glutamine transport system substrate-binding protein
MKDGIMLLNLLHCNFGLIIFPAVFMSNSFKINNLRLKLKSKPAVFSFLFLIVLFFQSSCFSNPKDTGGPEAYLSNIVDADGSLKRVMAANVLKVGADPNSGMPFIVKTKFSGEYEGFEADISKYIGDQLGCTVKFVPTNWENLLDGLEKKNYDIVLNALEKPEDNKLPGKNIGFSNSYYVNSQHIIVSQNNTKTKFLADLKGQKVGVLNDSLAKVLVSELNKIKNAGITLVMYTNTEDLFSSLKKNLIEAVIIDTPIGTWNCKEQNNCKLVGVPIFPKNYVIAVRKDDRALLIGIDAILRAGKKNNKLNEILGKWSLE